MEWNDVHGTFIERKWCSANIFFYYHMQKMKESKRNTPSTPLYQSFDGVEKNMFYSIASVFNLRISMSKYIFTHNHGVGHIKILGFIVEKEIC